MHPIHQSWTDHNPSDPGMTILEQLDYALQDLAYRTNFPIPDLLADGGANPAAFLFSPRQILTTNPILSGDYQQLLLNLPGVKYAWINPIKYSFGHNEFTYALPDSRFLGYQTLRFASPIQLNGERKTILGSYRVSILPETTNLSEIQKADLKESVFAFLQQNRNLGEDFSFHQIRLMEYETIRIEAKLEIAAGRSAEQIIGEIYHRLSQFVNPDPRFTSLAEQVKSQRPIEKIFEGPRTEKGFLETDPGLSSQLRSSDLIRLVMETPGVSNVLRFNMNGEGWTLNLPAGKAPVIQTPDIESSIGIVPAKEGQTVGIDPEKVKAVYETLQMQYRSSHTGRLDFDQPQGRDRGLAHYISIQNHFPKVYGLGPGGLSEKASDARLALTRQLKAYLLFFDQILAQNFAQLAQIQNLFAFRNEEDSVDSKGLADANDSLPFIDEATYASQAVVAEKDELDLKPLLKETLAKYEEKLKTFSESEEERLLRRSQFLDHLLARMGEDFSQLAAIYARKEKKQETRLRKLLQHKINFLAAYPELSYYRARGKNSMKIAEVRETPGFEQYLRFKLGHGLLADFNFFIVEHIMLRPRPAEYLNRPLEIKAFRSDPFSLQLTIVIKEEIPEGIEQEDWRAFIQQTFDMYKPAHLYIRLRWEKENYEHLRQINQSWESAHARYLKEGGQESNFQFQFLSSSRKKLAEALGIWIDR